MSDGHSERRDWMVFVSLAILIMFVFFLLDSGIKGLERRVGTIETKVK